MKWSGGPVVAVAKVQGFRQIESCTSEALRATTKGYKLYDLDAYWASLSPGFFGLTVFLEKEQWLDEPFVPEARSRGESWVVVDGGEKTAGWLRASPEGQAASSSATKKPGRGSRTIPLSLRFQVLRRDDFRCTYCGRRPPEVVLHIDHVVPWRDHGPTAFENLKTACRECNLGKGATR
jgi:hypothetical protein